MKFIIQRQSDNKYLKSIESIVELEISEWTDEISEAIELPGGRCDAIIFRFRYLNYQDSLIKIQK